MDVNRRDRWSIWTPLLFSLVLVFGIVLGFNLRDTLRSKRNIVTVIRQDDKLEEIIDLIHEKYVDTVNTSQLYKDAVSGILKSLDPHTLYIPADELQNVNDDLDGGFSGMYRPEISLHFFGLILADVYKSRLILNTLYICGTGRSGIGLCWRATCQEYIL